MLDGSEFDEEQVKPAHHAANMFLISLFHKIKFMSSEKQDLVSFLKNVYEFQKYNQVFLLLCNTA